MKRRPKKPTPADVRAAVPLTARRPADPVGICNLCLRPSTELRVWREATEFDRPIEGDGALVFVGWDIEHHQCREDLNKHPHFPVFCGPCAQRDGFRCRHPDLKTNGGQGLLIKLTPLVPRGVILCPPPKGPRFRAESCAGFAPKPDAPTA